MMINKTELVGDSSLENVISAQEETHSAGKSEMCIGWNRTAQSYNITTGLTIKITKVMSLANDKAQLVTNTTHLSLFHHHRMPTD